MKLSVIPLIMTIFTILVDLEDNDEDGEDDLEEALAEFEVQTYLWIFTLFV